MGEQIEILENKSDLKAYCSQRIGRITPLFIAGIFYFVMNALLTVIFSAVEKKLDYYK